MPALGGQGLGEVRGHRAVLEDLAHSLERADPGPKLGLRGHRITGQHLDQRPDLGPLGEGVPETSLG